MWCCRHTVRASSYNRYVTCRHVVSLKPKGSVTRSPQFIIAATPARNRDWRSRLTAAIEAQPVIDCKLPLPESRNNPVPNGMRHQEIHEYSARKARVNCC